MNLVLVTAPEQMPVSLAEAKAWLRVDSDDDEALITALIGSATSMCEGQAQRAFITQTWRMSLDEFPKTLDGADDKLMLPRPRLQSVTSLSYYDSTGALVTMDPTLYQAIADAEPAEIWPAPSTTWPATQAGRKAAVQVTYVSGYGADPAAVDTRVKQAILLIVAHWYQNREAGTAGTVDTKTQLSVTHLLRQVWHGFSWTS